MSESLHAYCLHHTNQEAQSQPLFVANYSLPPFWQRGDTPLHLAARNGHLDAIQLLLQSFDTRDEVNVVGNPPLFLCLNG